MISVDTGAFVALIDRRDRHHDRAKATFATLQEPLITTYPVITEACYLLSHRAKCSLLRSLTTGAFEMFTPQIHQVDRMIELIERYADLPMDFADASLVVLAEELGHGRLLTLDRRDFAIYRWNNTQTFQNLLFPEG